MSNSIPDLTEIPATLSAAHSNLLCSSFGAAVDWQERCHVLEATAVKLKRKAARICEKDMECRVQEANDHALAAEDKRKSLEVKLVELRSGKMEVERRLQQLEADCRDKDACIAMLRSEVKDQRQLRLQEARLVEEKSAKIRDWVTRKIEEMESKNLRLLKEKENLKDVVNSLTFQLDCLKFATRKQDEELKEQQQQLQQQQLPHTSSAKNTPPLPDQVSSSPPNATLEKNDPPKPTNRPASNDRHAASDDEETACRPRCMPQVKIERRVFPGNLPQSLSMISSSNDSRELLNSELTGEPAAAASDVPTPVTLTPKEPASPLTPFLPIVPPNSPLPSGSFFAAAVASSSSGSHVVSAVATMPRRKKGHDKSAVQELDKVNSKYGPLTITRNYKKIYDPARVRPKPPTPPMRRLPSWESRIYAIAATGLEMPEKLPSSSANNEPVLPFRDLQNPGPAYEGLSVPVYAMLKGRAAQIRSLPFTGDSSTDSSDAEDQNHGKGAGWRTRDETREAGFADGIWKSPPSDGCGRKQTVRAEASTQSVASETSSDYAFPPDDALSVKTDSSDTCEPEQKLIKYTMDAYKKGNYEKSGYLAKLGGKVKCWQRRWFVLKNGELLYYKTPNDMSHKSRGHIALDANTQIQRMNAPQTFEVLTSARTYYLAADTVDERDQWIRVLLNVLHKHATDMTVHQARAKETISGWLVKTRNGRRKRRWCVLIGKMFIYYRSPADQTPLGQINLQDARVEEVDHSFETDSDTDVVSHSSDYTLAVWPHNGGPTYLLIPVKQKKDSWLYHLTVACGGGLGKIGTEYEQLIAKLMAVEGDNSASFWKDPVALYTKEPLARSLTTLPSEDLQKKALDLFKQCYAFMHTVVESAQLDALISLAQSVLGQCLQLPELQTEFFCQMIRQTSRHPHQQKSGVPNFLLCGSHSWFQCDSSPTSPNNSMTDLSDSKLNPTPHVLVQGWQLLTMAISLFVPKQSVLWYLRAHLQRNADARTEAGKYAIFCQCALERTLQNGSRERRPSRMEILSILLRNPYHHSQPISIPVHFVNGSYQVISFDGSTTVQEFILSLNKAINMRDCALSGFALFTDDPNNPELEQCLKMHLKLCDVISKWEQALPSTAADRGVRIDAIRTVKLTYKNRLYFKSMVRMESERERLLLAHQMNEEIIAGRFPLNQELALELTALMAQIEYGDIKPLSEMALVPASKLFSDKTSPNHSPHLLLVAQILERFYPSRYHCSAEDSTRLLEQKFIEKWTSLRGKSVQDCVRVYLTVSRKWAFFGAKLFSAKVKGQITNSDEVWLAVNDDGIAILQHESLKVINSFNYSCVVTFGGCREDFMMVVDDRKKLKNVESKSKRLFFVMTKPKVLEATLLIASYINGQSKEGATETES